MVYICVFAVLLLSSCKKTETINLNLDNKIKSAKQLVEVCEPFINKLWEGREYHLGQISMTLNKKLEGKVVLTYADETSPDNPNVIEAEINTTQNKILKIRELGRDSKLDPGRIRFTKWKIDSTNAYNIALSQFKNNKDLKFDEIFIRSNNMYKMKYEVWVVELYNSMDKKKYWSEIDAYTGKVYRTGVEKLNQ